MCRWYASDRALVHSTHNSQLVTGQCRKDRTEDEFQLSFALGAGTIAATQELCEVVSGPSSLVNVDAREENINPCRIVPQLHDRACNVSLADIDQASTVWVCSLENGVLKAISGQHTFTLVRRSSMLLHSCRRARRYRSGSGHVRTKQSCRMS